MLYCGPECVTRDRMAAGPSLTGDTVLCPLARHIYPYLVLVQPMTRPQRTEKLLTGTQRIKPNKQTHCPEIICMSLSVICFSGINVFIYLFREYKCTIRVPN